jgi:SAM-dependent methyltransferase
MEQSFINYSHKHTQIDQNILNSNILECKQRLQSKYTDPVELALRLKLLEELTQFDLGQFLLINRGLNGYWTDYVINYPREQIGELYELEQRLLRSKPFYATYERQQIFKKINQTKVKHGAHLAAIPCGLMSELLDLDFSQVNELQITGIDLDNDSLLLSQQKYAALNLTPKINYLKQDAFSLTINNHFDLISSNGLTIYLADDKDVLQLFTKFYEALKIGGVLVTSFLTYPSLFAELSEQTAGEYNDDDHAARIIFGEILEVTWSCFRTTEQISGLLKQAGFSDIAIHGDSKYIFPTCVATKG